MTNITAKAAMIDKSEREELRKLEDGGEDGE